MILMRKLIITVLALTVIFGCTTKTNLTGAGDGSGITPIEITLPDTEFTEFYSIEDSTKNYANNTELIFGNYDNITSKALFIFSNFPDTISSFESTDSIFVTLTVDIDDSFGNNDPETNLNVAFIKTDWEENEATWFIPIDDSLWANGTEFSVEDYELIDDITITDETDTLRILLPEEIITNWVNEETDNFGLLLFTDNRDDAFSVINSSEAGNGPKLSFKYKKAETDTVFTEYSKTALYDTFITDKVPETDSLNVLKISNICPTKMFIKFDIEDYFTTNADGIDNIDDLNRMTINKAELILHQTGDFYMSDNNISLKPYLMTTDEPQIPFVYDEDYKYIPNTVVSTDSLDVDEFKIDVTKVLQAITSGDNENFGIMIRSEYESKNFENVEFTAPDPNGSDAAVEPSLRIIYTPPYLDE